MNHPLQCKCGALRGHVTLSAATLRVICYCKDCQAFAYWLGTAPATLDEAGGTDVIATLPSHVKFEQGLDVLACVSFSDKGLLRWYASCCRTPIGNTPRGRTRHFVGLTHSCLASRPLESSFGPLRVRVNTSSASAPVAATPLRAAFSLVKLLAFVLPARLTGRYRINPFFDATSGETIRRPHSPSVTECADLQRVVPGWEPR